FDQQLRERLTSELKEKTALTTLAASPRAADTLLELMVYEPNISGREGINPGLRLSLGLRVRLLDARSGRELYSDYLDYRGAKHTLVTWAADDARLFRSELDRCLAHLSTEIVEQFLTRPSTEIADRDALAALGIERRPPSPGAPGWSLPRTLRALARN
ncbi:MAG: LPS assembly lipoprotein LptE, partial [Opitutaceae bacterium]